MQAYQIGRRPFHGEEESEENSEEKEALTTSLKIVVVLFQSPRGNARAFLLRYPSLFSSE
jgi:hypothetical protein